jgi:hypothetical protein
MQYIYIMSPLPIIQAFQVNTSTQTDPTTAMTDFDRILAEATKKGEATVHGVIIKCVDKNGES